MKKNILLNSRVSFENLSGRIKITFALDKNITNTRILDNALVVIQYIEI